jgi:hypothetical protein
MIAGRHGQERKLHNDDIFNFFSSPVLIMTNSTNIKIFRSCDKHGRYARCTQFLLEKLKGRDNGEELGVDSKV